ncbi:MAG: hypothetical protein ABFR89_09830 [Actinomycetota bacterium]
MNRPFESSAPTTRLLAARRFTLPWVLWVFGLSTTLLLVGLWGRAVVVDEETVSRSTEAALSTEAVTDQVYDWIGDGLAASVGISGIDADHILHEIEDRPEAIEAVDALIEGVVAALIAPPGEDTTIDVAAALMPLVPDVVEELEAAGLAVPPGEVEQAVESLDPVELDAGEAVSVGVVTEQARSALTLGVLIAAAMLTLAGAGAVALSEERWPMLRSLLTRIAFSALSFSVLFRIGGWVLDPDGGRSPLRRSGAILMESNLNVFLGIGVVTAVLALAIWVVRRPIRRRLAAEGAAPSEQDEDTSTQELVGV